MRFRTEIELPVSPHRITHSHPIVLIGSCFSDEIGKRLSIDGFDVIHNPLGPLYNPLSIYNMIYRSLSGQMYDCDDFIQGPRGYHCLDYASRYSGENPEAIAEDINRQLEHIAAYIRKGATVIITLGSAFAYRHKPSGRFVGNCHKLPNTDFERCRLSVSECYITRAIDMLAAAGAKKVIITVSPIRHLADGLAGNSVSKATLRILAEELVAANRNFADYFPSYEIMIDDLRDYRFYASDMKHPSETAVEYIYDIFSTVYFDKATAALALEKRKEYKRGTHRTILQ